MAVGNFRELLVHVGHEITVVTYGKDSHVWNVSAECEECGTVLIDFDNDKMRTQ